MAQLLNIGSAREAIAAGNDILIGQFDLTGTKAGFGGVDIPHLMPIKGKLYDVTFKVTEKNEDVPLDPEGKTIGKARSWMWTFDVEGGGRRTITGRVPDYSPQGMKAWQTLRTAAESAGYPPEALNKSIGYTIKALLDKEFVLLNKHKIVNLPNGTKARDFDDVEFLTPTMYSERLAQIEANGLPAQPGEGLPRLTKEQRAEIAQAQRGGGAALGGGAGLGGETLGGAGGAALGGSTGGGPRLPTNGGGAGLTGKGLLESLG